MRPFGGRPHIGAMPKAPRVPNGNLNRRTNPMNNLRLAQARAFNHNLHGNSLIDLGVVPPNGGSGAPGVNFFGPNFYGLGNRGYGGLGGYGYGYGSGRRGFGYGIPRFILVYIPGFGWMLVPIRALGRLGLY
jgi:hypothetical protein